MESFVSGRELCRQFFEEAVRPVLDQEHPGLAYGAALLGRGSEVLGYDDELSADHDCQARVSIFLAEADLAQLAGPVAETLRQRLPAEFRGRATAHDLVGLDELVTKQLGVEAGAEITELDWLGFSEQQLLMITAGAVFHDQVGLREVRDGLAYYPDDVWLYLLSTAWWRVHPELNLVGRTGSVGDELGSALIGSRLVNDLIRLGFLLERRYAPYPKWFGTAFSQLPIAAPLTPLLQTVLDADGWPARETALMDAYRVLGSRHNELGLTDPVPMEPYRIWNRPFQVLWGDFPGALQSKIASPMIKCVAERWPAGGVDQLRDRTLRPTQRTLLLHQLLADAGIDRRV